MEQKRDEANTQFAKEYVDEVVDGVRKTILDLSERSSGNEVNVEVLGDILQEDQSIIDENENGTDKKENLNNHLGRIEIRQTEKPMPFRGGLYM